MIQKHKFHRNYHRLISSIFLDFSLRSICRGQFSDFAAQTFLLRRCENYTFSGLLQVSETCGYWATFSSLASLTELKNTSDQYYRYTVFLFYKKACLLTAKKDSHLNSKYGVILVLELITVWFVCGKTDHNNFSIVFFFVHLYQSVVLLQYK